MTTRTDMARTFGAFALAFASLAAGCGRDEPPAAEAAAGETDPVKIRMNDPEYVQKLETKMDERRELMRAYGEAQAKLAAAEEAGAPEAELEALRAAVQKAKDDGEANRQKAMQLVRDRMNKDISGNNLKQTKGN